MLSNPKMKYFVASLVLVAMMFAVSTKICVADQASDAYDRALKQLKEDKLTDALSSIVAAYRADRTNKKYSQEYMMLRQVIQIRGQIDSTRDAQRWAWMARVLHTYYLQKQMRDQAVDIAKQMYERTPSTHSASTLADALLSAGRAGEAADMLAGLDTQSHTPSTRALQALSLAKADKLDEAKTVANEKFAMPENPGATVLYRAARMYLGLGEQEKSLKTLAQCFESIAPSRLDAFKQAVETRSDFKVLAGSPELTKVMKVKSKISESSCSGGSSCSGCPKRGSCPGSR